MSRTVRMAVMLIVLGLAGCSTFSTYLIDSQRPAQPIIVDGQTEDWAGRLYIIGDGPVSLGLANDRDNLYVCLLAEDNFLRAQIMMQGLTVWFDPQGGKKETLGLKYPLGRPRGGRPGPGPGQEPEGPDFDRLPAQPPAEVEIIRAGEKNPQKMSIAEARGIELRAVSSSGLLVYELKIPLLRSADHPIAVGVEPGRSVGVGFETGKADFGGMMGQGPRGIPGGGSGVPPTGGGPGRGGRGGLGMGPGRTAGIRIWTILKLDPGGSGDSAAPARLILGARTEN